MNRRELQRGRGGKDKWEEGKMQMEGAYGVVKMAYCLWLSSGLVGPSLHIRAVLGTCNTVNGKKNTL